MSSQKSLAIIATAVFAVVCFILPLATAARSSSSSGFVYVMTNNPSGNSVIEYSRASNGMLNQISEVSTGGLGGTGNGVGALDPLGSQDSLVLGGARSVLLAVNAGSNQLSAITVSSTGLHVMNTVSSGGTFPNSVALAGTLVYVLNAHGTPNISGFRLSPTGLIAITNSKFDLPGTSLPKPHDIRFSLDGMRLLVSDEGNNQIDVFQLDSSGLVTNVKSSPSPGSGPFGMRFARDGVLLNAEANSNSVSSYILNADNTLTVISPAVANGQAATCWISVTADGKFAFTSNTGAGDLSSYHLSANGTLDLEQAVAATAEGGNPIDSALSADSAFLYAVDTSMGKILIYRVTGASLALIGSVSRLPTTVQGIEAQ